MLKPGTIEAVIYFVNGADPAHPSGFVMLAPYSDFPTPSGYRREYADTLKDVDKLEARLQQQERDACEQEMLRDMEQVQAHRQAVRDRLYAKMISDSTSEYDKEFIRGYLQLRDERAKEKYRNLKLQRDMYLWARHNDIGNRGAGEEIFHADRISVKS
jgi:hypothetical protein